MLYTVLLVVHSIVRWLVLIFGVLAVVRAFTGRGKPWTAADDSAGKWYVTSLDMQTLVGLLLYGFLSPITWSAFANMGAAMKEPSLRFYSVEHILSMVVALALAHVGRVRIRRELLDSPKFRTAAIFYTLSLLFVLIAIPWPFRDIVGRPWIRLWG